MRASRRLSHHLQRSLICQAGATLVEFVVVVPTVLFMLMNLIQYGLLYHAKSQLNYATYEAARAGSVSNADPARIRTAFARAMTGYYGGGTTTSQLAQSYAKAVADNPFIRIEILSPTKESFDDYNSPALAAKLGTSSRVIPNSNLAFIKCPMDVPGCNNDPQTNVSGQTLADANLLKVRITYGIPEKKQIPLAGRFMTKILEFLNSGDPDAFRQGLVAAGRIPVVVHTVIDNEYGNIKHWAGNTIDSGANYTGPARIARMVQYFNDEANAFDDETAMVVDTIGFSRGTAQARDFANRIVANTKNGWYSYKDKNGTDKCQKVNFRFMGLYDTVLSTNLSSYSSQLCALKARLPVRP